MDDQNKTGDMSGDQGGQSQGGQGKVDPSQIQKFLEGVSYPASKQDLVDYAKMQGADESVLSALNKMPEEQFQTSADVSQAIGQLT